MDTSGVRAKWRYSAGWNSRSCRPCSVCTVGVPDQTAEGEREIIYVAVDHVEIAGAGEDEVELADQIHEHEVAIGRAQTHRAGDHRDERGGGPGIAAREERDVVAAPDQFFGEMGHHPFGPPVELRRHRLEQGRNLSDTHWHFRDMQYDGQGDSSPMKESA